MSKETDRLDKFGIHNNHNLTSFGDRVWVEYRAPDYSRGGIGTVSGWKVYKIGANLGSHWLDRGAKRFGGKKADKDIMLQAIKFASNLNGEKEWVKSPFGGWISRTTADKAGVKYNKKQIVVVE